MLQRRFIGGTSLSLKICRQRLNAHPAVRFLSTLVVEESFQIDSSENVRPKVVTRNVNATHAVTLDATVSFRKEHKIMLRDNSARKDQDYAPMLDFNATPFHESLKRVMTSEGFLTPTPTQAQSWPIALQQRDIISVAKTGSGKTCGFLLPAFQKLIETVPIVKQKTIPGRRYQPYASGGGRRPTVLVLAPTRELTVQIESEAQKFSKASGYSTTSVYGGTPKGTQIRQLNNGVDVLIATPGRCMDLADMGVLKLSAVKYLVLDEADRMLDMGFEPQIRAIVDRLPAQRQSIFFSATWPREVQALASEFLTDPVQISIGDSEKLTANLAITQHVMVMKHSAKENELVSLLSTLKATAQSDSSAALSPSSTGGSGRLAGVLPKMIIFVSRKSDCDNLVDLLLNEGYSVDSLHGDKSQALRERTMDRFRKGRIQIMVATDVASRGLDVKDIEAVVNYDFPVGVSGIESYVHRIGRTARGNNSGVSYTFFTPSDSARARDLIELLKRCQQVVPPELAAFSGSFDRGNSYGRGRGGYGGGGRGRNGGGGGRGGNGGRYSSSGGRGGGSSGQFRSTRGEGGGTGASRVYKPSSESSYSSSSSSSKYRGSGSSSSSGRRAFEEFEQGGDDNDDYSGSSSRPSRTWSSASSFSTPTPYNNRSSARSFDDGDDDDSYSSGSGSSSRGSRSNSSSSSQRRPRDW